MRHHWPDSSPCLMRLNVGKSLEPIFANTCLLRATECAITYKCHSPETREGPEEAPDINVPGSLTELDSRPWAAGSPGLHGGSSANAERSGRHSSEKAKCMIQVYP